MIKHQTDIGDFSILCLTAKLVSEENLTAKVAQPVKCGILGLLTSSNQKSTFQKLSKILGGGHLSETEVM